MILLFRLLEMNKMIINLSITTVNSLLAIVKGVYPAIKIFIHKSYVKIAIII